MTRERGDQLPTLVDQNGSRRGRMSNGDINLPIANWNVSVVAVSRFLPFLRLHFHGHGGPDGEPWQLAGDDGSLVVSVAGGGLALWDPQPTRG